MRVITVYICLISTLIRGTMMLKILKHTVPNAARVGETIRLQCDFDLQEKTLYSVKWFKDNNEFFSFLPNEHPRKKTFSRNYLKVNIQSSGATNVLLNLKSANASGEYKCVVSAEAPSFDTVSESSNMTVVAFPVKGPYISGKYIDGDIIKLNCTTLYSQPATLLTWLIHNENVNENDVTMYPVQTSSNGSQNTISQLQFQVTSKYFKNGLVKIQCVATIDTIFWKTCETIIHTNHYVTTTSVMEIKDISAAGRPNCTNYFIYFLTGIFLLFVLLN